MATSSVNLPPGFQLEEEQSAGLPPGFVLEKEEEPQKADWATAGKTHFASLGNIFDMAGTLAWSVPASTKRKDEMYKNLNERKQQRDKWANPENQELSFLQKAAGVPTGLISMPLQPTETAKTFLDQGESGTRAALAGGVDAIGTLAGLALPIPGAKMATRAAGNATVNAAQDYITRRIIGNIAQKDTTKKIFDPTLETTALAGLTGGVWGAVTTKKQPKVDNTPLPDTTGIEAAVKEFSGKAAQEDGEAGNIAMRNIAEQQLKDWVEPLSQEPQNVMSTVASQIEQLRYGKAQQEIDARQAALEVEVKQRAGLDFNAAERARQESAPTGYAEWVETQRRLANERLPGNNEPLPFETSPLLDSNFIKQGDPYVVPDPFKDATHHPGMSYAGGIDATDYVAGQKGLPIEVRDMLGDSSSPDPFNRYSPQQAANRILREGEHPPIIKQGLGGTRSGMGHGQRGILRAKDVTAGIANFRKRFGNVEDSINTPISEQTIQAKQELVKKAKTASAILSTKLPEWTDPATFEEAVTLAREAKDIKSNPYLRGVAPGNNFMATYHNNPVLKYMRRLMSNARAEATKFSKTFLTAPDGLSTLTTQMDKADQVRVAELITQMDKHQVDYTPELGAKVGLSETASKFMQQLEKVADENWAWAEKVRSGQGIKSAPKRKGYAASLWSGEYRSLVLNKDGDVVGFIAAATPGEFDLAIKYYRDNNPGAKFSAETWQKGRSSFTTGNRRALRHSDLADMIKLLSNADGDFAKVQQQVQLDTLKAAHEMYGQNAHNMRKKGITGNLGNKPWLSPEKNARQRLDSIVRYFEESAEYLALQKPAEELRLLAADESLSHMPKTKEYIDDYLKNAEGTYVHSFGNLMNNAFSMSSHVVTEIADKIPGARNYIGPGNILRTSNVVKNKMSQLYMGWGNWMFTVAQLTQPVQNGAPMLAGLATKLGLPQTAVAASMMKATGDYVRVSLNATLGNKSKFKLKIDADTEKILEYGRMRGILDFSELERAYEGHKTKAGRIADSVAEYNMKLGEEVTRPPMFLAVVDMLRRTGANLDDVLYQAENITNQIMADYHQWERPLMYNGLGVMAPHAGGLTTFKHNFLGNQVLFAKDAKEGNPVPALMSASNMLILAGLTGIPFYGELNTVYEELRGMLGLEHRSIAQSFMQDFPQWVKTGVVSSILDLNMQGKFSAADMVPDTAWKGLFPHLSGAANIATSAAAAAKNPNDNTLGNLVVAATPSGAKQAARMALKQDDEGNLLNKQGQVDVHRTPEEWSKSAKTGLYPLGEANKRDALFQNRENERVRTETLTAISAKFKDAVINGASDEEIAELLNKYEEFGGIGAALVQQIPKIQMEADKTSQERAEGIPKSPQGIRRYEAYQQ